MALGLRFERERHGDGPEHLCAKSGELVFEVYPSRDETEPHTRLGFEVDDIDRVVRDIEQVGGRVVKAPSASPWGIRAVVEDPDGHRVELTQPGSRD